MIAAITSLIASALSSVSSFFRWKSSSVRQRRLAEAAVKKEEAEREAKKDEIRTAVYTNDDAKLNDIVNRLMKD